MPTEPKEPPIRYTPDGVRIIPGPDGLEELDNPMPRWMAVIYVGTVVWSIGYLMCMPGVGMNGLSWSQYKVYHEELVAAEANKPPGGGEDAEKLALASVGKPEAIASGKATFATTCAACHGADGKGAIGPNLTDAVWLYGGTPGQIAHTIANGTAKGMPTFKSSLSPRQIADLADFVHSLGGGVAAGTSKP
jgi:cytochrome c oxidase cbb3-type subunit 3